VFCYKVELPSCLTSIGNGDERSVLESGIFNGLKRFALSLCNEVSNYIREEVRYTAVHSASGAFSDYLKGRVLGRM